MKAPHKVVIVGGGFAGLYAAKALGKSGFDVTLVDKRNFHLFQPCSIKLLRGLSQPIFRRRCGRF
ncbi:FAD-dependent oxidoreductase [Chroococcidiopsis cubana]|uniref:FAD-dependent oxidoreductase n=1 Tax=Chroococcidiopsis cubana TaxID=171392 RepID=UPI002ACEDEA1|nr:FAD-dependent oxidoreductase [Chroococcidiopsis cubana]